MHDENPIYDPVRQIAEATAGINATLARMDVRIEQGRDLSVEVLKTQRVMAYALWTGWGVAVMTVGMIGWLIWQTLVFAEHNALLHAKSREMIQQQQLSINEVLRRQP